MNQETDQAATFARLHRFLLVVLLILLGFLAVVRLLLVYLDFSLPVELTFPNSVMAYHARDFMAGEPIYLDFNEPPHVLALYGPLAYAVPGVIGESLAADEVSLLKIGRSLSLLCTAGSVLLIAGLLFLRERAGWLVTCVMVLLFATGKVIWPVSMCFRPDAAEGFLVLLGLAGFLCWERSPWRYAVLVPFVVAFLFKQSAVVGLVAIVVYLLAQRRFRDGAFFAAASLVVCGVAFWLVNASTGGLYYLNAFKGLRANLTASNLHTVVLDTALVPCLVPFALAAAGTARRWAARLFDGYSVFFVISFVIASLGTLRDGSSNNYFLLPLAIGCLIGGQELVRWRRAARGAEAVLLALVVAVLCYLPSAGREFVSLNHRFAELRDRGKRDKDQLNFVATTAERLDALGGPILCQYDPVNLLCKNAVLMDTLTMAGLADQGVFDDRGLIEMIRRRKFAAIVLRFELRPGFVPEYQSTAWFRREWLRATEEAGYRPTRSGPLFIYTPP